MINVNDIENEQRHMRLIAISDMSLLGIKSCKGVSRMLIKYFITTTSNLD